MPSVRVTLNKSTHARDYSAFPDDWLFRRRSGNCTEAACPGELLSKRGACVMGSSGRLFHRVFRSLEAVAFLAVWLAFWFLLWSFANLRKAQGRGFVLWSRERGGVSRECQIDNHVSEILLCYNGRRTRLGCESNSKSSEKKWK